MALAWAGYATTVGSVRRACSCLRHFLITAAGYRAFHSGGDAAAGGTYGGRRGGADTGRRKGAEGRWQEAGGRRGQARSLVTATARRRYYVAQVGEGREGREGVAYSSYSRAEVQREGVHSGATSGDLRSRPVSLGVRPHAAGLELAGGRVCARRGECWQFCELWAVGCELELRHRHRRRRETTTSRAGGQWAAGAAREAHRDVGLAGAWTRERRVCRWSVVWPASLRQPVRHGGRWSEG
ncbi:hypothetical protein P280DRAFT_158465 [Massarina eburnea CBS 473.64]|uniref:Uncharacterized protein n=1 Tax=Massarina eburnea CBS 473.64 TaxID=1395130 RepID=A0A6A6RPL0_9PLEO|nr:hypothetical protein P280DRAFT_158465 [Massarina eburnea CBS 473.64]